ncbi:MAG: aminomethyl-transferring glycine dehydrogenase subunit GcvPA [Candidatus Omnitrophota bacterium]|nr:MAG: aminomethyl-transferring glycine dehydrogenase subunit GcvPA [Candidatus Omnitrophota bacterium]
MPYILNTNEEIKQMLKAIGVDSVEELYSALPPEIKLKESLNLPSGLSEFDVKKKVTALSERNKPLEKYNSFLGAGCYDHYIPAAVSFILSRSQFLTAYTPYQSECSQGILQAIYEYQSYICLLTGMDVSNASLFDGASALAEAVLMTLRISRKKRVVISSTIHPEYKETLKTYLSGFDFMIEEFVPKSDGFFDLEKLRDTLRNDVGCVAFQSPNFLGLIEDAEKLSELAKKVQALTVMVTNPLSLAILKDPARSGVDIVCGDGQPLGGSLNFGGPSLGFIATKNENTRQMPGRIVGKTEDKKGDIAYCLTLQTREQHIRREKATSNICSNQSLNAIGAAVYLSLIGSEGLKEVALNSFRNTQYLYQRLKEVRGVKIPFEPRFFNEFVWEVENAPKIMNAFYDKNIIAGYFLGESFPQYKNSILSCCTEKKKKSEIDEMVFSLAEVLRG